MSPPISPDLLAGLRRIESRANPLLREIRALARGGRGQHTGFFLVEGVRLMEEALDADCRFRHLLLSPRLLHGERGRRLAARLREGGPGELLAVPDEVMDSLQDSRTHQGILAVVVHYPFRLEELPAGKHPTLVLAHRVQDPGNVGAIVRTADAAGADGVVTTPETANPFGPKAVRGAMGSLFRLPVVTACPLAAAAAWCRDHGLPVIAAHLKGESLGRVDLRPPFALLVGREGEGLAAEDLAQADRRLTVPIRRGVDSLNVGAATAVILFEAARQRGYRFRAPYGGACRRKAMTGP